MRFIGTPVRLLAEEPEGNNTLASLVLLAGSCTYMMAAAEVLVGEKKERELRGQ